MEENQKKESFRKKAELLLHHLKPAASAFALGIGASLAATLLRTLFTQIIRFTVDHALLGETEGLPAFLLNAPAGQILVWCAAAAAAVALLEFGAGFVQDSNLPKGSERFVKSLRDALYGHIQRLPYRWHVQNPTGDIIQRCTSDVEVVRNFIAEQMVELLSTTFLIVVYMAAMFTMNVKISLFVFAFIPVIVGYSLVFYRRISKGYQKADEAEGELSSDVQENITGVRVVRAFGREEFERARFEAQNQEYTSLWVKLCYTLSQFWAVGDVTSCLQVMLVVVFGSILCVNGDMTKGEFISFAFYNAMLITPVRRLGRMFSEMSKAGVSVDRLAEVLNAPVEEDAPGAKIAPMDKDISFAHVSFSYETGPEVLHDVSFTIPAGSSFGILGATGSGKSTLLLLLSRLYAPTKGKITVGGVDLASMPAKWVRENVGVVLQEPFLFSRTIEENIGICGADHAAVCKAAETACIAADIEQFADGYQTMVGERGVTLSGGQKQRVAIARMLTKKTPIMVFDDSLSAVDTQTDEKIRTALGRDLAGTTTIIISHRITTLMDCDNVLVLEHGKLLQYGPPQTLLQADGLFRQIYDMQMSIGEEEPA